MLIGNLKVKPLSFPNFGLCLPPRNTKWHMTTYDQLHDYLVSVAKKNQFIAPWWQFP